MISDRRISANRRNARRSSGPKSAKGKKRAAQNSLRHGLSVSPLLSQQDAMWIKTMVEATCGNNADPVARQLSQEVFLAQAELLRVRRARDQLLSRVLKDPNYVSKHELKMEAILAGLVSEIGPIQIPERLKPIFAKPSMQERFSIVTKDFASQLDCMERYESRALSKRRKSISRYLKHVTSQFTEHLPRGDTLSCSMK